MIIIPPDGTVKIAVKGGSISLTCKVSSLLEATVQWKKPTGEVVNASADGRFSIDENNELTIDPVHERDEGKWTCEASNQMGADELVYTVDAKFGR